MKHYDEACDMYNNPADFPLIVSSQLAHVHLTDFYKEISLHSSVSPLVRLACMI